MVHILISCDLENESITMFLIYKGVVEVILIYDYYYYYVMHINVTLADNAYTITMYLFLIYLFLVPR